MTDYVVSWHIDMEADDPIEAAMEAFAWLRDPENLATFFHVQEGSTAGVVFEGEAVNVQEYDRCTCPPGVAEGVIDGPLCPYCQWQSKKRHGDEIPY